jgi:putative DNA primase/helicase
MIDNFRQSMRSAGIETKEEILADGILHRFYVVGDRSGTKNGWYVLHGDGTPAGRFGSYKTDIDQTWSAKDFKEYSPEEKAQFAATMKAAQQQREEMQEKLHAECREWCKDIIPKAKPADPDHPYLRSKGIKSYGVKALKDMLMIPLRDSAGELQGAQFIGPDGTKKFKTGTDKKGRYFSIGQPKDKTLIICEGYATGASLHECTGHAVAIAFDAGNLQPVAEALRKKFQDIRLIVCADNDQSGVGQEKANAAAAVVGGVVVMPPDVGDDFNDLHQKTGSAAVKAVIAAANIPHETRKRKIVPVNIIDFLGLEFPPRENLISPWMPSQGLTMVYAARGIGKTHFALGVAYAVASGGSFLGWQAPYPAGVLYLDGEMPGVVMQERLGSIILSNDKEPSAPFILLTPDLQPEGMPRIDTEEGQRAIESVLTDDIRLIVVDNISTLAGAKENEADGWTPIQAWALRQRATGRSVLFVHHSGKAGQQRGTSRREDVLDTVISLRRPIDYQPDQGAVFEIHFEKARGIYGDDVKSIEATLSTDSQGRMTWLTRTVEAGTYDRVVQLLNEGMKQTEIAVELGLHKSNVSRHAKKAMQEGLVKTDEKVKTTTPKRRMIKKEVYPGMVEIIDGGPE